MLGADLAECVITRRWQNKDTMTTARFPWQPQPGLEEYNSASITVQKNFIISKGGGWWGEGEKNPFRICLGVQRRLTHLKALLSSKSGSFLKY